ncbi:MAG: 50S ribosomal protein L11 methyltransferase [Actinobacteria bacterium]|nr:50S ribosomal protein L11 methyltransferase [Actinomycetota bacterium]
MLDFLVSTSESELLADMLWSLGVVAVEERQASGDFVTLRTSMGVEYSVSRDHITKSFPNVIVSVAHIERSVADTWRAHAAPTWVTEDVVLCPAWVTPPDAPHVIRIEPADTFGLGNHTTTVLALQLGLRHCKRDSRVFDFGCGSGVLAIAVTKILQCESFVFDIAHNAREVVNVNNELNNVNTTWLNDSINLSADLVFANILAPVLIAESTTIKGSVHESGLIVLSGMRDDQVQQVLLSYSECLELERESRDGWTAVILRKM